VLEESAAKIKRERASVKKLEGELRTEEAALEEITNSLKGAARPLPTHTS
jgi:hypothetical protein